jgi:iron complex outermembrane recepter protein
MRISLALALWTAATPALAQEIVVTAERRPVSTDALAGNAASLSADELRAIGPQVPGEALNRLPGVDIQRNNGVENLPAIRSPVLNGGQSAGSFLVLEDGVPIRAPGFANVNDLWETSLDFAERVEVVRGPGSALYGSNAVHGLVNVITPTPAESPSSADFTMGDFGRLSANVLWKHPTSWRPQDDGVPTMPNWGFIAGANLSHEEGWRADSSADRQNVLLGWDGALGGWSVQSRATLQNLNQETASFIVGHDAYKDEALARTNPTPDAYRDTQLARARVTLERGLGQDWSLRLTPYARWINADLALSFLPSHAQELSAQTGGGVQSTLYWDPGGALSIIFGADYDSTRGSLYEFQSLPDQPNGYVTGLHYDYSVDMDVAALYAQASWAFARDWRLIAGLRGEHVAYAYDNHAPDGDVGRFRRPADRHDEFDAVTPKLGVVWTPIENQSLWLNFARGARPPQITDLYSLQTTQQPGEQKEEKLDSVELGWRARFGDARVETVLYHMNKRDSSFRNALGFTVTDAATRHDGVELSGSVPLGAHFELSGWATYAVHSYRFSDPVARAGESVSYGDDIDTAPRRLGNIRLAWRPLDALSTELEWAHEGAYYTNADNTARYPGHNLLNLRADWRFSTGALLFLAVRNLADVRYAERADYAFGNDRYFPGEPRGVTLGVRANLN